MMAIETPGTPTERLKESLIVQDYTDNLKTILVHTSKTVKCRNPRFMMTLFTALNFKLWSEDVRQVYIQGHHLTRAVYS